MTTASAAAPARPAVPVWFWIVAVLALLWELAGCFAFYTQMTMTPEAMAKLPVAQREIWEATPVWINAAYGVAVVVGLAGAILLLLRRRLAATAFLVSLAAVIVQFGYTFLATPILKTMPLGESAPFPAFVVLMAAGLWWFAGWAGKTGWLG